MRSAVLPLLFVVGVAFASQVYNGQVYSDDTFPLNVPITDLQRTDDEKGQFTLNYGAADGSTVQEHGQLKETPDKTDFVLIKGGTYSYYDPSGNLIVTKWTADENGYQATGDHLSKS